MTQRRITAFTSAYNGISNVLKNKASIGPAFNPNSSNPPPDSAFIEFNAIWDTGATGSVISRNVVKLCGLKPIAMTKVNTANGVRNSYVYLVCIRLPNKVGFPIVRVTEGDIGGADILIGMDIIASGDLAVTNYRGKTTFSFRMPSIEKIDFVDELKKKAKQNIPKVGRNDPCPCGSGKKYKKCCGKNT